MKVFAIIVMYNGMRRNWIQKCIDSLLSSSKEIKIIIIDNNSSDQSVEFIKQSFPEIILIESKENLGFGKANNLGISEALKRDCDFVFLLNQDAWIEKDTILRLVEIARKNPEFGVISPVHFNGNGTALDLNFSKQIVPSACPDLYSDFVTGTVKNKLYSVKFVCAAAWLVSKECLRRVGGFNPIFFHYGEDDNYLQRVYYKNLKVGIYPLNKIYHDRQEREKSSYDSRLESTNRNLLLKFSNPNEKFSVKNELKLLKRRKLKALLLNDKKIYDQLYEHIHFLRKNYDFIIRNSELTKSNQEYLFLDNE